MNELNPLPVELDARSLDLAKLIGARQAMGLVAGRCSAADAEMLRHIRDEKKYLALSPTWDDFCQKHLHMSKRHADRTIRLVKELGPAYFELSQLTRISPQEFRRIAVHVRNQSIHLNGEAIAMIAANTERVAAAVAELSGAAAPEHAPAGGARLAQLERRCRKLSKEFQALRQQGEKASELAPIAHRAMVLFESVYNSLLRPERDR